jgi:hypothetical protein
MHSSCWRKNEYSLGMYTREKMFMLEEFSCTWTGQMSFNQMDKKIILTPELISKEMSDVLVTFQRIC